MTLKHFLFALWALAFAAAAQAGDHNLDSSTGWMIHGDTAAVTHDGTGFEIDNPTHIVMVGREDDTDALRGQWVRATITISGYVDGSVQPFAGLDPMMGTPTGADVPTVDLGGQAAIADNFTTADGLDVTAPQVTGSGAEGEPVGAWRIRCDPAWDAPTDNVARFGQPGGSHGHTGFGNTEGDREDLTYEIGRIVGMSSCGNADTPNAALWRTTYWHPTMFDMLNGRIVRPKYLLYYKRRPASDTDYCGPGYGVATNRCLGTPHGLTVIDGWDFATNTGGPDSNEAIKWACEADDDQSPTEEWYRGTSMVDAIAACAANDAHTLRLGFDIVSCWDGERTDSTNHRDHMAPAVGGGCFTEAHPYQVPGVGVLAYFPLTEAAFAGHYRLSSDSMEPNAAPGSTIHMDYRSMPSPYAMQALTENCHDRHLSCNGGDLGNETGIDTTPASAGDPTSLTFDGNAISRIHFRSMGVIGLGKPVRGNGTFTSDLFVHRDHAVGFVTHEPGTTLKVESITFTPIDYEGGPATIGGMAANDNAPGANDNVSLAMVAPIAFDLGMFRNRK